MMDDAGRVGGGGGGVCQARLLLPVAFAFDGRGAGLLCWCEGAKASEGG